MPRRKEKPLGIVPPNQNAHLLGIRDRSIVLGLAPKLLEQEARRGLHALALNLPQTDLIDDRGRQHGIVLGHHLRMRVRLQVRNDLRRRDAHGHRAADRVARQLASDQVRKSHLQVAE